MRSSMFVQAYTGVQNVHSLINMKTYARYLLALKLHSLIHETFGGFGNEILT